MKKLGYIFFSIILLATISSSVFFIIDNKNDSINNNNPIPNRPSIDSTSLINYISFNGQIWIHAMPDESSVDIEETFTNWFNDQYQSLIGNQGDTLIAGIDYTIIGDFSYSDNLNDIRKATITPLDNEDNAIPLVGDSVDLYYYVGDKLIWNPQNQLMKIKDTIYQPSILFSPTWWEYDDNLNQYIPVISLSNDQKTGDDLIERINIAFSKNLINYNFYDGPTKYKSNQAAINNIQYQIHNLDGNLYNNNSWLSDGLYNISIIDNESSPVSQIFNNYDQSDSSSLLIRVVVN